MLEKVNLSWFWRCADASSVQSGVWPGLSHGRPSLKLWTADTVDGDDIL